MINEFFMTHPVFTIEEFKEFESDRGTKGKRAAESLITYYMRIGRIIRIKRSLYALVPQPGNRNNFLPDPFLIASRMSLDSALVYHTALEFHGRSYSFHQRYTFQTDSYTRPLSWHNALFQPVRVPMPLNQRNQALFGVENIDYRGMTVRVSSLERTLVDVLDRPDYSGNFEEIWRSLESVEFFDLDRVVEYVQIMSNATTASKVGYFLEQHKDILFVEEKHLNPLREMRPRQPHYMIRRGREKGHLVKSWNLIVPDEILHQRWKEIL